MAHRSPWTRAKLWIPPLVYMALVFHLSSESNPLPELTAHVWDKFLHTGEYAALAFLLGRALAGEGLGWLAALAASVVLTSLYGASDEWHQAFVPMRDPDIHDWFADTTGALVGALVYLGWKYRLSRRPGSSLPADRGAEPKAAI